MKFTKRELKHLLLSYCESYYSEHPVVEDIDREVFKFDFSTLSGYRIDSYFYVRRTRNGRTVFFRYKCQWIPYSAEIIIAEELKPLFQAPTLGMHVAILDSQYQHQVDGEILRPRKFLIYPQVHEDSLLLNDETSPKPERDQLLFEAQALTVFKDVVGVSYNTVKQLYRHDDHVYARPCGLSKVKGQLSKTLLESLFKHEDYSEVVNRVISYQKPSEIARKAEQIIRKHHSEFLELRNLILGVLTQRV
jgi:hypothetical protein